MGPGRSLSGTPRWIFAGWTWLEQVGASWSWFLHPTAYATVAAQQELPVAASQQGPARPRLGATTALCGMGQGRHLSRPRRSLQSRRRAHPQSPKWGPGSKGAAPSASTPLFWQGLQSADPHCGSHCPALRGNSSISVGSPGTQAETPNTRGGVLVSVTFLV